MARRAGPWIAAAFGAAVIVALMVCFFVFAGRTPAGRTPFASSPTAANPTESSLPPLNLPGVTTRPPPRIERVRPSNGRG